MAKKKRWRVTLLRRETVDSSYEITVEGSNKEEAERNAVQAATSGRIHEKHWHVEDSETEFVKADPDQTERV